MDSVFFSGASKLLASLKNPRNVEAAKAKSTSALGVMFVSKPRGAVDDVVRTAETREEAQKLAKLSALIVSNKTKFLPRSGVSVRSRQHVIFDFKKDEIVVQMSLTSESETIEFNIPIRGTVGGTISMVPSDVLLSPKRRAEHVETLRLAIESLSLLVINKTPFKNGVRILQKLSTRLCRAARQKIDDCQRPIEEKIAKTAAFQKLLDQVPIGSFVVWRSRGDLNYTTGLLSIYDVPEKLKPGARCYVLTPDHANLLSNALGGGSAHARLSAMRILQRVPVDHPAALPAEIASQFKEVRATGDLLARLQTLNEIAGENTLGEVFLVNPKMICTYSSYSLPYGYSYRESWEDRLMQSPLVLSKKRSSLPARPRADLITLDGVLCVSGKAKAVLESFDLRSSKFHYIAESDDFWAMEITEKKSGPVPDDGLYDTNRNGQRSPLGPNGGFLYSSTEELDYFAKRARFGEDDLAGADVWFCSDCTLAYDNASAIVFSSKVVKSLKKGKCKWYKKPHSVRVVDQ